jgi:hypothetical protein
MRREQFVIYPPNPKQGDTAIQMLDSNSRLRMAEDPRDRAQIQLKAPPTSNRIPVIVAMLAVLLGVGLWFMISHFGGH